MREETLKLDKVKKSCKITATVSLVLEIILIVCAVCCILGGVVCAALRNEINQAMPEVMTQQELDEFQVSLSALGTASIEGILHTDELMNNGDYGMICTVLCFYAAIICGIATVLFDTIRRIFKTIRISDTPFTQKVLKGIKVMGIVISIELLIMSGVGVAVLGALIFWSIYNIMDYGFTIQQQIDETL